MADGGLTGPNVRLHDYVSEYSVYRTQVDAGQAAFQAQLAPPPL